VAERQRGEGGERDLSIRQIKWWPA
jgi:hypothetical protein